MLFKDRLEAGKKLAERLVELDVQDPIVLALPRGGVPVGFEVAKKLKSPLDVLVVRKLGSPTQPEFGIGAIAPENTAIYDDEAIRNLGIPEEEIRHIEEVERRELQRRIKIYRGKEMMPDLKGKTVILVDDGLATGVTARAAIKYILSRLPDKLIVAMPVCALDSAQSIHSIIRPMKDVIICLSTPYDFSSVGLWYKNFSQVTDEEVLSLLKKSKPSRLAKKIVLDNIFGSAILLIC